MNTTFKLFVLFEREFKMINLREELPLRKLIQRLIEEDMEEEEEEGFHSILSRSAMLSSSYRNQNSIQNQRR